jgi:hypothetical protein
VVGNTLSLNYKVENLTIIPVRLLLYFFFTNSAAKGSQRMLYWQQPILLISTILKMLYKFWQFFC